MEFPKTIYGHFDEDAETSCLLAEIEVADCLNSASEEKVVGEYQLVRRIRVVGVTRVDVENV